MANWTTQDELEFLMKVGMGRYGVRRIVKPARREILVRYRAHMPQRKHWGRIDPAVIKTYLDMELAGGAR